MRIYRKIIVFWLLISLAATVLALDTGKNNLSQALSPYLRQHADNPIHWQPWSEEVLAAARQQNKPLFLSIGYASCHWCHVMERESFVDDDVAAVLNQHFISIKVDREERPDIDAIYMTALQIMKGEGGWPVNAFLTPDGEVIFIDSYITREKFLKISAKLGRLWQVNAEVLTANAKRLSQQIEKQVAFPPNSVAVDMDMGLLVMNISRRFDTANGGLIGAPKFPNESLLIYLLDYAQQQGDIDIIQQVLNSLDKMADSALFDQVSGGFHRYSVDALWKEPHFEKMLYNQALLVTLYSRAYALSLKPQYKRVVEQTVNFVNAQMQTQNLFFSSIDADTNHQEGLYYLYHYEQIYGLMPAKIQPLLTSILDISRAGNFSSANVIRFQSDWREVLEKNHISLGEWQDIWAEARLQLQHIRQTKPLPALDKKVITGWNALWIKALWQASVYLDRPAWQQQALLAQKLLLKVNTGNDLLKRFSIDAKATGVATLEDYSFVISMLLTAYDVTAQRQFLQQAEQNYQQMLALFYQVDKGLWVLFQQQEGSINFQVQKLRDDNFPSAYGVAMQVTRQLLDRTGDVRYRQYIKGSARQMLAVSKQPEQYASVLQSTIGQQLVNQQYFADGHGVVKFYGEEADSSGRMLKVEIVMQPGWHINSDKPGSPKLVATELRVNDIAAGQYPLAERLTTDFSEYPVNIWLGVTWLQMSSKQQGPHNISLKLQACSDKVCLAPETLQQILF
ncbi:MAG: thioredoxin domain-containing protein [Pseudomonadales bacterium]|nr:thioredoxin domain-containing protein [Pseudomonadales bacterium]